MKKKMTCCYNILTGYKVFLDIFESYGLMYRDTVISTSTFHIHSCKSVMFGDWMLHHRRYCAITFIFTRSYIDNIYTDKKNVQIFFSVKSMYSYNRQ